jgi:hypothetical protein
MGKDASSEIVIQVQVDPALATALQRGLNWLTENRDEFKFTHGKTGVDQVLLLKPFSEFVLSLCILNRLGQDVLKHIQWSWDQLHKGDYLVDLLVARPDLADLAGLYANYYECGFQSDRLLRLISHIRQLKSTNAKESSLWSRIALEYNYQRLGLTTLDNNLMNQSWIESNPEPWTISDSTAYAVTHEVFYMTDFGSKPDALSENVRAILDLWLPAWVRCFIDEGNWDIVSELLMVAACMGSNSWTNAPLTRLIEIQSAAGAFPAPVGAGRPLIDSKSSSQRQHFLSTYHTTLVGLMTLAIFHDKNCHKKDD